jgi:hypothetical protein
MSMRDDYSTGNNCNSADWKVAVTVHLHVLVSTTTAAAAATATATACRRGKKYQKSCEPTTKSLLLFGSIFVSRLFKRAAFQDFVIMIFVRTGGQLRLMVSD